MHGWHSLLLTCYRRVNLAQVRTLATRAVSQMAVMLGVDMQLKCVLSVFLHK
jgi:hypothetical protein